MTKLPERFIPTRESLLSRLKNWNDQEGWQEFVQIYRPLIRDSARQAGLTPPEAEDVTQETLVTVAKTIKEFKYDRKRCTFKTWLRGLTQKRIADCFRKRARERELPADGTSATAVIDRVPDPRSFDLDSVWEEQWRQKLYAAAVHRVKRCANTEQYQMFDLYVVKGLSAGEVAKTFGTNIAQVYLAKHRISKLIKKEVNLLETTMR